MTSYLSRGSGSLSDINVVQVRITHNPQFPDDDLVDLDEGLDPELVKMHDPTTVSVPVKKSKFDKFKKLDYWMEGKSLKVLMQPSYRLIMVDP